jgi:dTDP-4-dehydrorhamnose reductase
MNDNDPAFRGRKVLITGGLGFIGSNLAIRLVEAGAHVTLVDNLIPEYGGNRFNVAPIAGRAAVNVSDGRDTHSLRALVRDQDYLFNLAGQTSHMDSMTDPQTDLEINCRAQLSILEICRGVNPDIRVVFASTRQIYGRPEYLPVDERHPIRPVDVNAINKMTGEWYHLLYHRCHGIRVCVLRLTNTYGPRMRVRDARQTFLGIWIRKVIEGGRFILGPEVAAFEREFAAYLGVPFAVGVASGTDALDLALRASGVGPGCAVVTVAHTAVATVAADRRLLRLWLFTVVFQGCAHAASYQMGRCTVAPEGFTGRPYAAALVEAVRALGMERHPDIVMLAQRHAAELIRRVMPRDPFFTVGGIAQAVVASGLLGLLFRAAWKTERLSQWVRPRQAGGQT